MGRMRRFIWVSIPLRAARLSRALAFSMADGHFTNAQPWLGLLLPVVSLVGGFAIGATTLGYERVFSESIWLMLLAVIVGFFSAGSGALFVAGFAVGDFVIGDTTWVLPGGDFPGQGFLEAVVLYRVPMLIGYALFGAVVIVVPMTIRALILDIPRPSGLSRNAAGLITLTVNVLLVVVGVLLWAAATAVLIRPLFTWSGGSPTEAAVFPLQSQSAWLALAAALVTVGRSGYLLFVYSDPQREARVLAIEEGLAEPTGVRPGLERRVLPGAIAVAAGTTLILSGTIQSIWVAGLVFAVALGIRLVRALTPPWLEAWRRLVARIPMLLRIGAGAFLVEGLRRAYLGDATFAPSFDQLAIYTISAAAIMFAILPGPAAPAQQRQEAAA